VSVAGIQGIVVTVPVHANIQSKPSPTLRGAMGDALSHTMCYGAEKLMLENNIDAD